MLTPVFPIRRRLGVGGIRLYDHPGIRYPKELFVVRRGMNRRNGRPFTDNNDWGVTSREAGRMMGCTAAAARVWLRRRRVPYRFVKSPGCVTTLYWSKARVAALVDSRLPITSRSATSSLITTAEALRILGVSRSSLYRYQIRGLLRAKYVRSLSSRGLRKCIHYYRSEVESLAAALIAIRRKQAEINRSIPLPLSDEHTLNQKICK